ncbi:hypothetical protein K458DRAFT_485677 [Lentithecium fluviatile CBS 122367]|uniref:Zn(2)-C6 fungal-type domain-containing protein n=1 Tax=Lentithecium fluviatile CBS 122367 TaxID=1168545 RepID=A0A6G1JBL0_9PLEO|nr:hypothetical protein K458DRAFT_485677 [Lentithecium fluviatile CBS 122367]
MSDPTVTQIPAEGLQDRQKSRSSSSNGSEPRRRWACDRCHTQKLRCLRTINPQEGDCDRCIRVNATCGYSPPGRMGRPARSDTTSSSASATAGSKRAREPSVTRPCASPILSSTSVPAAQKTADPGVSDPLNDLLREYHGNGTTDTNPTTFHPDSIPFGTIFPGVGDSGFLVDSPTSNVVPFPNDLNVRQEIPTDEYVRELIALAGSEYEQYRIVERARECTGLDKESLFNRLHGYPIGEMLENAQKLTSLVESLLQASKPRDSPASAYWSEFVGPLDPGREMILDVEALSSTTSTDESVLLDFPDSWAPPDPIISIPRSSPSIGSSVSSTPGANRALPDTSTTLLVLSCYIRLARLYQLFFADLNCFLLTSHLPDPMANNDRRLFPGLKLGSFQPFAGTGFEISMVVQVSEHMLNRLHKALGLSSGQEASETGASRRFTMTWNAIEMITPVLMRAVQAQDGLDARDDKRDTCTQLSVAIDGVKRLLRARAFL